jgi:hypothetical protein
MIFLKMGACIFFGLILGAVLFRTPKIKANPQVPGKVHVAIIPVSMLDAKNLASEDLPGVRVAGISCVPKPIKQLPDAAVCYVATTLAEYP